MRLILLLSVCVVALSCMRPTAISPQALAQENACIQAIQASDYTAAQTRCELCLEYNSAVPECINGLGLVAFARNDSNLAIKYFSQAIQISRSFAQARNNLGAVYFQQSRFEEALPFFSAAVEIDPGYQDARYNLGLSYLRLGQKAMAKKDFKAAQTNYDLAETHYLKLVAISPTHANGYRDLGLLKTYVASMETDTVKIRADLDGAEGYFKQCLQADSGNEDCYSSYGHTLLYLNQYDKALYQFVQCLAHNKNNSDCIKGLADASQGSQLKGSALSSYIQRIKNNPNDAQGHLGYCSILFQSGIDDSGIAECKTAIKLDPKLCSAYYQLAMHYKRVLDMSEAVSSCRSYLLCDLHQKDPGQTKDCQQVVTSSTGP